jgi:hypothetical protein
MRRLFLVLLLLAAILPAPAATAAGGANAADAGTRTIHFGGEAVGAPASWPVYRLAERPRMCVRLDRKAVYLGTPGAAQRCPANAIGRRRAILVDPRAEAARASARRVPQARVSATAEYTGLGFDACTAPSSATMRAWESSPYRAIGVYIGGLNRGCSQPNLTASWVAAQTAAGWHLIPTYVGLQAPTSSCTSCATLSAGSAALQGAAAASDAVADAQAIGIGPGSPIYYDMESYSRTASATSATLTFLGAWTTQLHALGYDSGVYSSSASGIADLVSRIGGIYPQPDDLWMANWNGQQNTLDPYVPASAWSQHQRIHQYRGGHNETWGGVAINIDNNYVEGATVGSSVPTADDPVGGFDLVESPAPGQVRVTGWAIDPNAPKKTVAIRAQLGGTAGQRSSRYELGPVAVQERSDLFIAYPKAGGAHGFDASFPVVGSGRQKVCVYAVNIGRGADALLGCRTTGVPLPIAITGLEVTSRGTWVALRCDWPTGAECPGQILLRSRVTTRSPVRRKGRLIVRKKTAKRAIARRAFRLTGGGSHSFRVVLSGRGRELTRDREKVWAQLVVAIPGGSTTRGIRLR